LLGGRNEGKGGGRRDATSTLYCFAVPCRRERVGLVLLKRNIPLS
jgi:hypothetical protein